MTTDSYTTVLKDIAFNLSGYPFDGGKAPRNSDAALAICRAFRERQERETGARVGIRITSEAKRRAMGSREGRR